MHFRYESFVLPNWKDKNLVTRCISPEKISSSFTIKDRHSVIKTSWPIKIRNGSKKEQKSPDTHRVTQTVQLKLGRVGVRD